MISADIAFLLAGDIRRNSRALRQLRALGEAGFTVQSIGLADTASNDTDGAVRIRHLPSPAGTGPRWFLAVHRLLKSAIKTVDARLYHASDLFVLPAAADRARSGRRPVTFDSRELYPHVGATAHKPWASFFWSTIEQRYIRRCAATFTVCDSIANRLEDRYRIDRPVVIRNVPAFAYRPEDSEYLRARAGIPRDGFVLLYQGHLKPGRGCERLIDAIEDVPGTHAVFMGDGPLATRLIDTATSRSLRDRVHHVPAVEPDVLLSATAGADVGMCLIEPVTESLRLSLPNKLFEYLWAGRPVIGSNLPEIGRVIDAFQVGYAVDPYSRREIAEAVVKMKGDRAAYQAMKLRTRDVAETYAWETASEAFVKPFISLLSR